MANSNDFQVILQAVLDSSGIGKSDIAEVQKVLEKYHLNLTADINKTELIKTVKHVVPEIEAELKKATGVDIKITDKALTKAVNQAIKDQQRLQNELKKTTSESQRLSKINTVKSWADNNTKAMGMFGDKIKYITDQLKRVDLPDEEFRKLTSEFEKIKIASRDAGLLGKTWTDSFKDMGSKFFSWLTISGGIMAAVTGLRKMKDAVIEIDTAMTNLFKVTDETSSKYNDFLEKANANAQKLGRSVSSLITQSAEWAKLGFNIDKSAELAQVSSIYANVGEVDDKTAVSDMVTAMKANLCLNI